MASVSMKAANNVAIFGNVAKIVNERSYQ